MCASLSLFVLIFVFFFNDTATTEIYTLSLHDALPISVFGGKYSVALLDHFYFAPILRSEEHTSELQSRFDLVCRLLLEKKKYNKHTFLIIKKQKKAKYKKLLGAIA